MTPSTALRWPARVRDHPLLIAFVAVATTSFVTYGFFADRPGTLAYLATIVVVGVSIAVVHVRVGFSRPVLWALGVWAVAHLAGGLVPTGPERVLYNTLLGPEPFQYDRFVHAFGFGTATAAAWQVFRRYVDVRRVGLGVAILVGLCGMGIGAINEVIEFGTQSLGAANVGGYVNTGWDLVADLLGSSAVAVWVGLRGDASVSRGPGPG